MKRIYTLLLLLVALGVSIIGSPKNIYAAETSFIISEYGSGQTSLATSVYWRGYVFQVTQDTTITKLVGGGASSGFIVGIYEIDQTKFLNDTGTSGTCYTTGPQNAGKPIVPCVKALEVIGYTAPTILTTANQELDILGGNYPDDSSKIFLEKNKYYLLASGKTGMTTPNNNQWTVGNIDVGNLTDNPLIGFWSPDVANAKTFRWTSSTTYGSGTGYGDEEYITTLAGQNNVTGDTLPMLGFFYETDVPQAIPMTIEATLNSSDKTVTMNGSLDNTAACEMEDIDGACETTAFIRYGTDPELDGGDEEIIQAGTFSTPSDNHTFNWPLDLDDNDFVLGTTYYYRAEASNLGGLNNTADIKSFQVRSLTYAVGSNGSISGDAFQLVFNGEDGSAVTAVPDSGYIFVDWSDSSTQNPRTDTNVTSNKSVTANFEEGVPTPTPTNTPSNNNSSSSSSSAPSCGDSQPTGSPDLFQIDVNNTQAILYFAPVANANNYFISYGEGQNTEVHGVQFDSGVSMGVLSYTVNMLTPNTTYSFKVRSGNGCMPGDWGNTMEVKTKNTATGGTTYYKNFIARILSIFPQQVTNVGSGSSQPVTLNSNSCEYVVKPGDSLWNISSARYGTGVKYTEIMQQNGLQSTLIRTGQTLKVGC